MKIFNKKPWKVFLISLLLVIMQFAVFFQPASATRGLDTMQNTALAANYTTDTTAMDAATAKTKAVAQVTSIITVFLEILGVIILVIIIYSGFLWITAGGNQEQVTKARKWLINAIIGAAIIGFSYLLAAWIEARLVYVGQ